MLSKAYANPKLAAVLVGVMAGLIGAGIFSLAGWLDGTPTMNFVVVACLVGFVVVGGISAICVYFVFAGIGESNEKQRPHQRPDKT